MKAFFTILFIISIQFFFSQNPTCGYDFSKTITIDGGQISGGPHVDFPVLISHIDADLATASAKVTSASGFDIIFADDNGALLDFQLESYNGATGEIVVWVKIPSVTNGTDVDIHMLYGKPSIVTDQSTTNTWSAGYNGVWHLNSMADNSGSGFNGTDNGTSDIAGSPFTGRGRDFVDPDDWIELNSGSTYPNISTGSFTISAWVKTDNNATNGQRVFCDDATNANGGFAISIGDGGAGRIRLYMRGTSPIILDSPLGTITTGNWHHVVAVQDIAGTRRSIYVDGVLVANNNSATFSATADGGNSSIGGEVIGPESANRFNGVIDEVKTITSVLSQNWITTEFNSQNQPTTTVGVVTAGDFYTVGTERSLDFVSNGNGDWDLVANWVGANVPGMQFDNVTITNHDIDIDGGSGDYTVCSCTINGDGSSNAYLDISSTRVFTVKEDIAVNYSGAGVTPARLRAFNSSVVNISGDLILNSVNTDLTQDLYLRLRNDATINVSGDLNASLTAGKDLDIDLEDNSILNIGGDLTLDQSGGDLLILKTDDLSSVDVSGNLIVSQSGGSDLLIYVNDNAGIGASFIVDGTSNFSKTGGDDIVMRTNGTNSALTLTGNTFIDCPSAADTESINFDANDGLITLSNVTASRSLDMGEIDFDLDGGNITMASLNITSSGSLGGNQLVSIDIDANSVFTCSGNLSVNMTGGDDFRIGLNRNNGTTGVFNCLGNLSITQSGGDDIDFYIYETSLFNVGGNLSITQTGGEQINIDLDDAGTLNVTGNCTILHVDGLDGQIDLQAASTTSFSVGSSFTVSNTGGGDQILIDINDGTMQVGADMTLNVFSAGITEDIILEIDGAGSLAIGGNFSANLTGGDDIEIDLGNSAGASTANMSVTGSLTLNQNQATANRVVYLTADKNTTLSAGSLTLNYTSGSLLLFTLLNNALATINGDIDLNTGASGTIEIRTNNTSELRIAGNFDRTPSAFGELDMEPTATLEFFGSAAQVFPEDAGGGGDIFDYGIVEINNSSAANPQITMEGNATVHGGVVWIDGVVASSPTELLIFDDNATTSGASNASHCDGQVQKIGDDAFTFPTGDNDYYGGIEINSLSNQLATDIFTAQYFEAQHPESYFSKLGYETAGGITDGMEQTSRVEYWELTRDNGSCEPVVRLYWSDNARSDISDLSSLVVAHNTAVKTWKNEGGNTGGVLANGFVESTTKVTTFSPFTFGSLDASNNDLPIELVSFTAVLNDGVVDLNWTTASEINNEYFEIENSKDGIEWQVVAKQDGAGNSIQLLHYEDKDYTPLSGVSYYRLKQVDYDGQFAHSKVVKVTNENGSINIFPNPNNGLFQVTLESIENSFQIICYDIAGKRIELDYAVNDNTININTPLSAGIYVLSVLSDNNIYSERITVK